MNELNKQIIGEGRITNVYALRNFNIECIVNHGSHDMQCTCDGGEFCECHKNYECSDHCYDNDILSKSFLDYLGGKLICVFTSGKKTNDQIKEIVLNNLLGDGNIFTQLYDITFYSRDMTEYGIFYCGSCGEFQQELNYGDHECNECGIYNAVNSDGTINLLNSSVCEEYNYIEFNMCNKVNKNGISINNKSIFSAIIGSTILCNELEIDYIPLGDELWEKQMLRMKNLLAFA